jgi:hypothetical protein
LAYTLEIHTEEKYGRVIFSSKSLFTVCVQNVACSMWKLIIITANHKPMVKDLFPQDKVGKEWAGRISIIILIPATQDPCSSLACFPKVPKLQPACARANHSNHIQPCSSSADFDFGW